MSDDQNQRFKYLNNEEPEQGEIIRPMNDKQKLNNFAANADFKDYVGKDAQKMHQDESLQNSRMNSEQKSAEEKQKDRQIRKLTNINKHLLEQLKQQNEELTRRVNKQKFRIPRKSIMKSSQKTQQNANQIEPLKKQLQNAYRQIQFYKQSISLLKAKQISLDQQTKLNETFAKLKQKNEQIQKIQDEIKTQKGIKYQQDKQLGKIQSIKTTDLIQKLDDEISQAKAKLKQSKHNLIKREQLQKKQHLYLVQFEFLIKKTKLRGQKQQLAQYPSSLNKNTISLQEQITEQQWKQIKQKVAEQKKKYEDYGKKLTYQNYLKSKQSKIAEQVELKFKEKFKTLEKLKSKLNQVNKLARLRPKPQIMERVDLKMQKLKDIISRHSTVEMLNPNKIKARVQSQDVRQFKKWQLEHASRQNSELTSLKSIDNRKSVKNQSEDDENLENPSFILPDRIHNELNRA